jgi:hypothetical protein
MHDTDGLEGEYGPIPAREVVLADDLIPIVRRELDERTRLWNEQAARGPQLAQLSPLTILAADSGVPERSIWRILNGDTACVDLALADRILMSLDLNISLTLPPEAFVPMSEARLATQEQTELMKTIARRRGEYVPPAGSKAMRTWSGPMRRKLSREGEQAA